MPEYSSIARVLSLLRILADPTHERDIVNLAARFETSVKTVRRDIQELRSNGVVVSEDSGPFNRKTYSIDREELPPLRLTYDEALAVFLGKSSLGAFSRTGLEHAATSAFQKLRLTLGETEANYVDKLMARIHFARVEAIGPRDSSVVDDLLVAIEDCRAIFIEYSSANSTEPLTYDIFPYGLTEYKGSLYVVGFSCHHSEVRTWKIERIHSSELTIFPFKRPVDFDIAQHFEGAFAIIGGKTKQIVRIRFDAATARYVREKRFHPSQQNELQNDGRVIAQFTLTSLIEIRSWLLSFGAHAEVLEPDELRKSLREEAEQLSHLYSGTQLYTSTTNEARKGT